MKVYGLDGLEGYQIIGWDPLEKKFRSWVYDSDGGFGTGLWSKKGDGWQVAMNYVLSDGSKATAVNIYDKISSDSYNFSSIDRQLDGKKIENIEPVEVVREEL
jgi:hypothetical protein